MAPRPARDTRPPGAERLGWERCGVTTSADWVQAIGGVLGGIGATAAAVVAVVAIRAQRRTMEDTLKHERLLEKERRVAQQREDVYRGVLTWYQKAPGLQRSAAVARWQELEGALSLFGSAAVIKKVRDIIKPLQEGKDVVWSQPDFDELRSLMRQDLVTDEDLL